MSCANLNFSVCRGGTFRQPLVYQDSTATPIDISTWTATWTVGTTEYTSSSINVVIGPEDGTIHLVLTSTQVDALGFSTPYRLVLHNPSFSAGLGDIPLIEGKIEVE